MVFSLIHTLVRALQCEQEWVSSVLHFLDSEILQKVGKVREGQEGHALVSDAERKGRRMRRRARAAPLAASPALLDLTRGPPARTLHSNADF